jgi:hypothetical protein
MLLVISLLKCDLRPSFWKWGTQATVLNQNQKYFIICIDLQNKYSSCFWWSVCLKCWPASLIFESEGRRPQFSTKFKYTYYLYRSPQISVLSMLLVISSLKMRPASLIFESERRRQSLNQNQKYFIICIDLHKIISFHAFGDQFA